MSAFPALATPAPRWHTIACLGSTQTLSWASSYYLPAILAEPLARDLGVSVPFVFLAFSAALFVSAGIGPGAGRAIDRYGGRPVLATAHALFALALGVMALASGPVTLLAAWLLMGVAMGAGLYEAAFATLVRLYGPSARNSITGITLIAGFASTVGWPLTAAMEAGLGWRGACLGWAALHLLMGLPLTAWLPAAAPPGTDRAAPPQAQADGSDSRAGDVARPGGVSVTGELIPGPDGALRPARPAQAPTSAPPGALTETRTNARPDTRRSIALRLSIVFAIVWFISTAMATHLPAMLQAGGLSLSAAVAVGALIGPAQVAGRLLEFGLLRHMHPLLSARLAALTHPVGAVLLLVIGPVAAPAFALLHGAGNGNGIMTIAKGTLPLALFGSSGYGASLGWMMLPARVAQALSPVIFGVLLTQMGSAALWVSALLAGVAAVLLMSIRGVTQASALHED